MWFQPCYNVNVYLHNIKAINILQLYFDILCFSHRQNVTNIHPESCELPDPFRPHGIGPGFKRIAAFTMSANKKFALAAKVTELKSLGVDVITVNLG